MVWRTLIVPLLTDILKTKIKALSWPENNNDDSNSVLAVCAYVRCRQWYFLHLQLFCKPQVIIFKLTNWRKSKKYSMYFDIKTIYMVKCTDKLSRKRGKLSRIFQVWFSTLNYTRNKMKFKQRSKSIFPWCQNLKINIVTIKINNYQNKLHGNHPTKYDKEN